MTEKPLTKTEIYEFVWRSVYNSHSFLLDKLEEKGIKLTDQEKQKLLDEIKESIHKVFLD